MGRLLGVAVKVLVWLVVLGIPLLGVWTASAMAALLNGPLWVAPLGGALLFPLGPLAWDLLAQRRRRRRAKARSGKSFLDDLSRSRADRLRLGLLDRLLLRTLALNVAFVGGLAWLSPSTAADALAARGDWMLDHVESDWSDTARGAILSLADRAQALAVVAEENPYQKAAEPPPPPAAAAPAPREAVTLRLPDGAVGRVQGRAATVTGTAAVPLTAGTHELSVSMADGRGLLCPLVVTEDTPILGLVAGETWHLGMSPCTQYQAPDPTWRPTLHRVIYRGISAEMAPGPEQRAAWHRPTDGEPSRMLLSEPVVRAREVTRVQERAPYLRLSLSEVGSAALCQELAAHPGGQLAVVVDEEVLYTAPIFEAACDGTLSVPMTESAAQRAGIERARELTGTLEADSSQWPLAPAVHPAARDIPPELAESVQAAGAYFKRAVPEPLERLKALHDFTTTRIAYDVGSLEPGQRQPQDADTVLRRGLGVCAGYANLMVALGEAADIEVVYLIGHSRDQEGGVSGVYHAWNAAQVDGKWYLIDATWDAGSVTDGAFKPGYKTDYLLTPPDIFATTHLPEEPLWQLSPSPISRGEFARRPMLRPSFFAAELSLLGVDRSQVTVDGPLSFSLNNPRHHTVDVEYETDSGYRGECEVSGDGRLEVRCPLADPGRYTVMLFHKPQGGDGYTFDGRLLVNRL